MSAITFAGETLIATLAAGAETLSVDKLVLAHIPGLDHTLAVDRSEGLPAAETIMDEVPVSSAGVVNDNVVVYSTILGSERGTYSFNWMGLYSTENDTVVAIAYVPLQEKRATVGGVVGNVMTKNFAVEFNAAADVTGTTVSAESWQVDYTARLRSMDENNRAACEAITGAALYQGDAFKVVHDGSGWKLTAGAAIIGGHLHQLAGEYPFVPGALPGDVWVKSYLQQTMLGALPAFEIVMTAPGVPAESEVVAGVAYRVAKLASITSEAAYTDDRETVTASINLGAVVNQLRAETDQLNEKTDGFSGKLVAVSGCLALEITE
ncbi:hypothetical protein GJQ54_11085 [Oceanospirillaceae bacterium ASx5O]|nr:hypothetical protein GJQ54_11085 [Oceanospirillaceae bacterium ASx5O]